MAKRWSGMLAPVGSPTGDGRRFQRGGVTSRALPLPLNWQRQSADGHLSSVTIGSIEELEVNDDQVFGRGVLFDDADSESLREDVQHAMELIRKGVVGPSVDPGAVQAMEVLAGSDEPLTMETFEAALAANDGEFPAIELLFTHYEIAGATLVSTPAFAEVTFCLDDDADLMALVAAVTGSLDLPVADRARSWDGDAAAQRVFDLFTGEDGEVDTAGVAKAFLWHDPESQDASERGGWKLPFADVVNGHLQIVPKGVQALAGGHGVNATDIADEIKPRLRERTCALYDRVRREFEQWPTCPFDEQSADVRPEAARAPLPTPELFMDPGLEQVTALAREDLGNGLVRVFGHLADPNSCHRGFQNQCMTPPDSQTDYALFHRYPMETAEGLISVGRLTSGLGKVGNGCSHLGCRGLDDHACVNFSFTEAVDHHDGLRTLAWVRVGVDRERVPGAIWFSGVLVPGLEEEALEVLSRRRVSGDWRDLGATRELCEVLVLAAAEPGFEVPRVAVGYRDGRQVSLVAAAQVQPGPEVETGPPVQPGQERPVEISAASMQQAPTDRGSAIAAAAAQARMRILGLTVQSFSKLGGRPMCCQGPSASAPERYRITFSDGKVEEKSSLAAARIRAARDPQAKIEKIQ